MYNKFKTKSYIIVILSLLSACTQQIIVQTSNTPIIKKSSTPLVPEQPQLSISPSVVVSPPVTKVVSTNSDKVIPSPNISSPSPIINVSNPSNTTDSELPYSKVEELPQSLNRGNIKLTFKDEYKIRYDKKLNKFISLSGDNIESVNNLLIAKNTLIPSLISGFITPNLTETKSEELEKDLSKSCNCDARNPLSYLSFTVKDISIADLIIKLRNNNFIREANFSSINPSATNFTAPPAFKEPRKTKLESIYYIEPIPEDLTEGLIVVTFKDEYKIRYHNEEKKFVSLVGADISSLSMFIINSSNTFFNSNEIYSFQIDTNAEANAEYEEKLLSEQCQCDEINSLSVAGFKVKDINVSEFILALRNNPFVRDAKLRKPGGGGAV